MIIDRPYPASNGELRASHFWMVDPATVGQCTGDKEFSVDEDGKHSTGQKDIR